MRAEGSVCDVGGDANPPATRLRSYPWRQLGKFAFAAQDGLQLGQFLVAAVVAARLDVISRDRKVVCRVLLPVRRVCGIKRTPAPLALLDEAPSPRAWLDAF